MQRLGVGRWGLFCDDGGRSLVRIDDEAVGPASARKSLDSLPRRLLLDEGRVLSAMATGRATHEVVEASDRTWDVYLDPVRSPRTRVPTAVRAIVVPTGHEPPEQPALGSWEWEIEPAADGSPSARRRIYWDRDLFELYGLDPDATSRRHDDYWETAEWIDTLIDPGDRVRMSDIAREGIATSASSRPGELLCLSYSIVTASGTGHEGQRHLRLVGDVRPEGRIFVARGFSYPVPDAFTDMSLWRDTKEPRVDDVLSGMMELFDDPVGVVDPETLDILVASDTWHEAGLDRFGGLAAVLDEDEAAVRDYVGRVCTGGRCPTTLRTRMRVTDGSWRDVRLDGIGVQNGGAQPDVLLRVRL